MPSHAFGKTRSAAKYTERSLRRSRVKFPRRNGGVADFQATKGVRCACEHPPEGYHINTFLTNKGAATSKPSPSGRRCHAVTDEGTEINSLLLFLIMSLRGTNRGIGTERGKGSLIVHSRVPWQSPPERVPLDYSQVSATKKC